MAYCALTQGENQLPGHIPKIRQHHQQQRTPGGAHAGTSPAEQTVMKTVIMHQTTSKQNDAANMHHPGFCAIHFHKQHQHNRDGNIFHRVTMNANSALQFAKTKLPLKWPMAPVYDRWQIQKREDCCGIAGTAPISGSVLRKSSHRVCTSSGAWAMSGVCKKR